MSESNQAQASETVHGKSGVPLGTAKKARKPAAKKAAAKPSANGISPQRALVVKELKKRQGTLDSLTKRTGLPVRAVYHHLWHLRKNGQAAAKAVDVDGKNDLLFSITSKGAKLA